MNKWVKRIMLGVALLLSVAALFVAGGIVLLRGTPSFYQPSHLTVEQRAAAAASAESTLAEMQNLAADAHGAELRAQRNPTEPPAGSSTHTFTFTDDELNALFNKWSQLHDWKQQYERYVTDPVIVVQNGRIIFAGKVKYRDMDSVVSLHFEPALGNDGKLKLPLVSVMGGKLPLPEDQVTSGLHDKASQLAAGMLPGWQSKADIAANGATNEEAMKSAMCQLGLHILSNEPAEPALFLPLLGHGDINIPVKVTQLSIVANKVSITVVPMNVAERSALLERIKRPMENQAVSAAGQ